MAELKQQLKKSSSAASYGPTKRKGNGFTRKCASLVKEQRARIYILRRCATMLLCWSEVYCHGFNCLFTNQLTPCMNTGWQG